MKIFGKNKDCTYMYDSYYDILYISLSFEDLTNIDKCDDYFMVACNDYMRVHRNKKVDSIKELIRKVKKDFNKKLESKNNGERYVCTL